MDDKERSPTIGKVITAGDFVARLQLQRNSGDGCSGGSRASKEVKGRMKSILIRTLLHVMNCHFLNSSPCRYGFIGNVDAFSYENLASEEKQRPGITVKEVLAEADRFRSCPIGKGVTVIQAGLDPREADSWDLHELRTDFSSHAN